MLQTGKTQRLIFSVILAIVFCNLASAETSLKPYSPFDESKPRIPKEIMGDKRLDVKVNVFVKSKNFRDLFAEISKQTGVKLTADRDIAAERAIIYFHARPLRDVMTELSGLFGYYWLPKGKPGAYTYELFEDSRHAKHRDDLRQARVDTENGLLLELLKQSANLDAERMKSLEKSNPEAYRVLTREYNKQLAASLSGMGDPFLKQILAAGQSNIPFSQLPPNVQTKILDWRNAMRKSELDTERKWGTNGQEPIPAFQPLTMEDMAGLTVHLNRLSAGTYGMPRLQLETENPVTHNIMITQWPRQMSEEDIRALTGTEPLPEKLIGDKLPDEPAITVPAKRKPALIFGDFLQGIAKQSGKDIIADYYFQEAYLYPTDKEPLGKIVNRLCDELDYSCQVDGSTLRFRSNRWFVLPLQEEPPAKLVEAWWNKIETSGSLDLDDIRDFASLPDRQMAWAGLRFMPGMSSSRRQAATLRLWNSLGSELETIARSEEGLSLDRLNQSQLDQLYAWGKLMQVDPNADWSKAVIRITSQVDARPMGQTTRESFILMMDNWPIPDTIRLGPALSETDRKALTAQRKADAEADKVEVVNQ